MKKADIFSILLRNPKKIGVVIKVAIKRLPYCLGVTTLWPGTFLAYIPDRYYENSHKAVWQTGLSLFKKRSGFLRGNRMTNGGDLARFYFFNLMFEQMDKEHLTGDIAELGVYKGNSAVLLANYARKHDHRTVYLFDTFEGFSRRDFRGVDAGMDVQFNNTSLDKVKALVGNEQVEYVVGYFPDSAAAVPAGASFCLVHLDCDLYEPLKAGLEYFYPRLVPGGFLVLHDYSSLWWAGAEKAIDEFLADKPETVIPIPDKAGTVVIRKMII